MRNLQRWQIYIANRVYVNAGVVNQMIKYFDGFYLTDEKDVILERYEEVNNLLKNAYWAKDREASTMWDAIANSLNYAIFHAESKCLVGFARVITDYATVYYVCDVFIAEEFRCMGLEKALVEWIVLNETKLSGVNGLLKTRDAKALYEKYGFEECKAICMVQKRN